MSIKWGTDSKVQYIEPTYGFPISIGASGEMSLRAEDSRKLLVKLVGTENFLGQQKLAGFFRSFLMTKVKTYIAQVMKANGTYTISFEFWGQKLVPAKNKSTPEFVVDGDVYIELTPDATWGGFKTKIIK